MGLRGFLQVFPGVFLNSQRAFGILGANGLSLTSLFMSIGLPILLLGAYGRVIGEVRVANPDTLPPMLILIGAHFFVFCVGLFLGSLMLAKLAPRYGVEANFGSMAKISIIAFIPVCLALFVSALFFDIHYLVLAGLLGSLFLLGRGLGVVFSFPPNRLVGFVFMSSLVFMGVMYFFLFLIRIVIFAFN